MTSKLLNSKKSPIPNQTCGEHSGVLYSPLYQGLLQDVLLYGTPIRQKVVDDANVIVVEAFGANVGED